MRYIFSATLSIASVILAGGASYAAECVNGHLTLANHSVVACNETNTGPQTTGSISGDATPDKMTQAKSAADCKPGQYYMVKGESQSTPMMCH